MMMYLWWLVVCISCNLVGGILGIGGGWEYSCNGVLLFSASVSSISGKKGNLFVSVWKFVGSF